MVAELSACIKVSEGLTGSKRLNSTDEFLVKKKDPLVSIASKILTTMPMPSSTQKKQVQDNDIEDLLGIKDQTQNDSDIIDIEDLLKTKKKTNRDYFKK